jgi:hypothetical protein
MLFSCSHVEMHVASGKCQQLIVYRAALLYQQH